MLTLEKYKTKSTRHECPSCGKKSVFTRYVDEEGKYIADDVGRCNRESKCGYHRTPKEYFADHPTERSQRLTRPRAAHYSRAEAKQFDCIPRVHLEQTLTGYEHNGLVQFLLTRFDEAEVSKAVARYLVGTDGGRCVFWQIDEQGRIRTGKLIAYNPVTGKRRKEFNASWSHAELKKRGSLPESFELAQCFFGEHLLKGDTYMSVGIVEAEKTALIASLILPGIVWLASGGKTQLNAGRLAAMRHRRILLFPDGDAFTNWQAIAIQSVAQGLDVRCSDLIEREGTAEEKNEGFDLADYLLASVEPRSTKAPILVEVPASQEEIRQEAALPPRQSLSVSARIVGTRLEANHCPQCGGWMLADHPECGAWCGGCRYNWLPIELEQIRTTIARRRELDSSEQGVSRYDHRRAA